VVQLVDALAQQRIEQHGLVDGRGAPVVRNARRKQGHRAVQRAVLMTVQVVADHPVVDDQQRPRLVRVHGVDVAGHVRVEDLGDARNPGPPCPDPLVIGHAKIVQDRPAADGVRSFHGYVYGCGARAGAIRHQDRGCAAR
jgi:hypothetical protein